MSWKKVYTVIDASARIGGNLNILRNFYTEEEAEQWVLETMADGQKTYLIIPGFKSSPDQ